MTKKQIQESFDEAIFKATSRAVTKAQIGLWSLPRTQRYLQVMSESIRSRYSSRYNIIISPEYTAHITNEAHTTAYLPNHVKAQTLPF